EFIIHSINMYKVFAYIENEDLKGLGDYLVDAIHTLDKAGASFAIITANTPHIVFEEVASQVKIPVYSIVLETLKRVKAQHIHKIALLGTKFTMAADFFKSPFQAAGIEVIVPTEKEQKFLHGKIVKELEKGIVRDKTKAN